jgi:hypothetical protein
MEET